MRKVNSFRPPDMSVRAALARGNWVGVKQTRRRTVMAPSRVRVAPVEGGATLFTPEFDDFHLDQIAAAPDAF